MVRNIMSYSNYEAFFMNRIFRILRMQSNLRSLVTDISTLQNDNKDAE